jgi:tripartite ATP-independent transporter DctM subunit
MVLVIFLLFTCLLFLGVPIPLALLIPGIIGCIFSPEIPIQIMSARLAYSFFSSSLVAIPLFIFAAQILSDIKICDAIFSFISKCVGHVRGGLAHVNVVASIIFAGMSGSATADAASLGKVEIEAMNKQGYPLAFSAAVTAASAMIAPIIPPSIPMIIFGSVTGISIGKLLIGGFIPGVVMAGMMMLQIALVGKHRGFSKTKFVGFREVWNNVLKVIPGLLAPVILIGGMLCGFFTPTEAATVAVVYAFAIGFTMKTLTLKGLWQVFKQSAMDSAAILVGMIGASLIGLLVIRLHVADVVTNFISEFITSPAVLLLVLNIVLLIAGCLLDGTCCIIILAPILVPLVKSFGINEVHFGVVMVLNLMIGMLTPPLGGMLFVTCRVAELKLTELLKEVWPFLIWLIIALMIVTYVPQMVLWLPSLVIK